MVLKSPLTVEMPPSISVCISHCCFTWTKRGIHHLTPTRRLGCVFCTYRWGLSEKLEKAGIVDFKKHPARKVGTRSRQCRPKVTGRFAVPGARNPRICSISRFRKIFPAIFPGLSRSFPGEPPNRPRKQPQPSRVFWVFSLTVRLFYLRWGNCKQKRPNPISGRAEPQAKKTKPNFRTGGNHKQKGPNLISTVSKKDQTEFQP